MASRLQRIVTRALEIAMLTFLLAGIVLIVAYLSACFHLPRPPEALGTLTDPMLEHAREFAKNRGGIVGGIPAVAVTLSTLTWLIRGLFIAAAGAAICSGLVGQVPVLGRVGARAFVSVAGICVGSGVACLVLSVIVTRVIGWIDRHPVVTAMMFVGGMLAAAGVWAYGHKYAIERWTNIDVTGDGKIGEPGQSAMDVRPSGAGPNGAEGGLR